MTAGVWKVSLGMSENGQTNKSNMSVGAHKGKIKVSNKSRILIDLTFSELHSCKTRGYSLDFI